MFGNEASKRDASSWLPPRPPWQAWHAKLSRVVENWSGFRVRPSSLGVGWLVRQAPRDSNIPELMNISFNYSRIPNMILILKNIPQLRDIGVSRHSW